MLVMIEGHLLRAVAQEFEGKAYVEAEILSTDAEGHSEVTRVTGNPDSAAAGLTDVPRMTPIRCSAEVSAKLGYDGLPRPVCRLRGYQVLDRKAKS